MNKTNRTTLACTMLLALSLNAFAQLADPQSHTHIRAEKRWKKYNPGEVVFRDERPESEGSDIYHRIIPDHISYIQEDALRVLQTL